MLSRSDILDRDELEVVIDDIDVRGQGRVRLHDGVLVVPGTLAGERVRVRPQRGDNSQAPRVYADLLEVLDPSEQRRDPMCERDAICQGCQLRHLTVAAELEFKVRVVREAVARHGGVDEDEMPDIDVVTPQPIARADAFRIRRKLQYRRCDDNFELGLRTPVRNRLVPMEDCPALTGPVQRLISTIVDTLEQAPELPPDTAMVAGDDSETEAVSLEEVRVISPTHGVGLVDIRLADVEERTRFEDQVFGGVYGPWLEKLAGEVPGHVGVAVSSGSHREYVTEPRRIRIPIGKWEMEVGYDDWFHATLEPAAQVYRILMDWLDLHQEDRVVDIGSGIGTITLMASEYAREVVGVDANPASIEAAEINAVGHGRENVRFVTGGWQRALRQLAMDGERFSVATINPLTEPLGRRPMAYLNVLDVQRLVYLGPSPEAAARDIGELRKMGWKLTRLAAGNVHPATYHTLLMAAMKHESR